MTALDTIDDHYASRDLGAVQVWLWFIAALILSMIIVGGATRLTDSGLSITEWKPIVGAIPPLNDADWQDVFHKYQQIPEYHHVNKGMSLEDFKFIFWWEWSHRFLGRFIGLAFALPLAVFWWRGVLKGNLARKLSAILFLGALQGAIGWYMVSSGLIERVDVSQYRLALHLSVAFLILASVIWLALDIGRNNTPSFGVEPRTRTWAAIVAGAVFVQVVLGALVAGLKAGFAYNTWPDMNGEWIPAGLWNMSPVWVNFFENVTTVQFSHRLMAYLVAILIVVHSLPLLAHWNGRVRRSALFLIAAVFLQILIGILTLLYAVPLSFGLLHQAGAVVLFALAVSHLHLMRQAPT
jgi:cytochrome c oxidase assembly protein subunit 15